MKKVVPEKYISIKQASQYFASIDDFKRALEFGDITAYGIQWDDASNEDDYTKLEKIPKAHWANYDLLIEDNKLVRVITGTAFGYSEHVYYGVKLILKQLHNYLDEDLTIISTSSPTSANEAALLADKVIRSLNNRKTSIKHVVRFMCEYYYQHRNFPTISQTWDDLKKASFVKDKKDNGKTLVLDERSEQTDSEIIYKYSRLQKEHSNLSREIKNAFDEIQATSIPI